MCCHARICTHERLGLAHKLSTAMSGEESAASICVVCQSALCGEVHALACGHSFHTDCILQWFRSLQTRCPLCMNEGGIEMLHQHEEERRYRPLSPEFRREVRVYARQDPAAPRWLKRLLVRESELSAKVGETRRHFRELERAPVPEGTPFKEAFKAVRRAKEKVRESQWKLAVLWRKIKCRVNIVPITLIRRRRISAQQATAPAPAQGAAPRPIRRTSARLLDATS